MMNVFVTGFWVETTVSGFTGERLKPGVALIHFRTLVTLRRVRVRVRVGLELRLGLVRVRVKLGLGWG